MSAPGVSVPCPGCKKDSLKETSYVRSFLPNRRLVPVTLLTSVCDECGITKTSHSQHLKNLQALADRKVHYAGQLMGEEFVDLRKKYGLTQQAASKIFGKGLVAFSRYESETSYPDKSTRLLIELAIENMHILKKLADKAGVPLPLWEERCEDAGVPVSAPWIVAA